MVLCRLWAVLAWRILSWISTGRIWICHSWAWAMQGFALVGTSLHYWYGALARIITQTGTQGDHHSVINLKNRPLSIIIGRKTQGISSCICHTTHKWHGNTSAANLSSPRFTVARQKCHACSWLLKPPSSWQVLPILHFDVRHTLARLLSLWKLPMNLKVKDEAGHIYHHHYFFSWDQAGALLRLGLDQLAFAPAFIAVFFSSLLILEVISSHTKNWDIWARHSLVQWLQSSVWYSGSWSWLACESLFLCWHLCLSILAWDWWDNPCRVTLVIFQPSWSRTWKVLSLLIGSCGFPSNSSTSDSSLRICR